MPSKKKIFVVDDHPIVRHGLFELIRQEPDLVVSGESHDSVSALDAFELDCPDIVIIDFSLSLTDDMDFIKTLRSRYPGVAVLVLTMHDEAFFAELALRGGAMGYLTKQEASENVLTAIRSLLDGELYVSDRISPKLVKRLIGGGSLRGEILPGRLSVRERQVFLGIGDGKTVQEIARGLGLSVKTVETYCEHIKEKLGLDDSRELTRYAIRWILDRLPPSPSLDS